MVDPRVARPTLRLVDEYCQPFAHLFPEVHSFEASKYLYIGMISRLQRKSLDCITCSSNPPSRLRPKFATYVFV
ncbi:hypothetical protein H6F91_26420 [Leptolyngbya sp. FACHB-8]|nr:hypothetical protein [Leptolyngbya sp. FACHB-8]